MSGGIRPDGHGHTPKGCPVVRVVRVPDWKIMNKDIDEKIKRVIKAAGKIKTGDKVHITILHDDDCPAIKTESLADCKCQPVIKRMNKC
jgi:hypothetical protein